MKSKLRERWARWSKSSPWWGSVTLALRWILLLLLLLLMVRPPGVLVNLEGPQRVESRNSKVGVHTRLVEEVEAWKIQRTLQMVREMGAPWIVEFFPWPYFEPDEGSYRWGHSDLIIEHARDQGVTLIARMGMVPEWARPDPDEQETTFTYLDEEHYDDFASFVAAFVARYRPYVRHVIIWNEPNLNYEWGYRPADPEAYVELLKAVYPAAHAANPDVIVLAGALAPTLEPEGGHAGMNDLIYLRRMYEAGAAPYFDALAAHTYGLVFPPEMPPGPELLNFRRVELLREIMVEYGDEEKAIYVTESGWNDHPRWTWAVKPSQRVSYSLEAFEWAEEQWPWCPALVMWVFRTPTPLRNYQDYFSFVTPDFRPRPIYPAVQQEMVDND
ncbi:MAG: hypothetical protein ACLFU8_03725 [Anaerolineales bacterium]